MFPINKLLLFTNINNAHGLMNYYNKWNIETESKKELANFIINSAPELTLLVQDADKILSI